MEPCCLCLSSTYWRHRQTQQESPWRAMALHGMDCEDVPDDSNDIINDNLVLVCLVSNVTVRHRQTEQECSR